MFFEIGVLKSSAIFTRKTSVLESLNKVAGLKACRETPTQGNFYKLLFTEHQHWLLLLFLKNS